MSQRRWNAGRAAAAAAAMLDWAYISGTTLQGDQHSAAASQLLRNPPRECVRGFQLH